MLKDTINDLRVMAQKPTILSRGASFIPTKVFYSGARVWQGYVCFYSSLGTLLILLVLYWLNRPGFSPIGRLRAPKVHAARPIDHS
jgi:hypothetical protein